MPGGNSEDTINRIEERLSLMKDLGYKAINQIISPNKDVFKAVEKNASVLEDTLAGYTKKSTAVVEHVKVESSLKNLLGTNIGAEISSTVYDIVSGILTQHLKGVLSVGAGIAVYQIVTDPIGTMSSLKSLFWEAEKGIEATIVTAGNAVESVVHKGEELASSGYAATKKVVMSAEEELAQMRKAIYADAEKYYRPVENEYNKAAHAHYHPKPQYPYAVPHPYYPKYAQDPSLVNDNHHYGAPVYDYS